jgi:Carbamoyl-phosphate synthase L chain, ATP binding domain
VPFERVRADPLSFDPAARESPYSLLVNRMSPSAGTRGHAHAVFQTLHYLQHLERLGAPVLNGRAAYEVELSKAAQASLAAELGLAYPRTRVVSSAGDAVRAADELAFPVLVKPNIGGSGAGIRSFETIDELRASTHELELGLDGTALVQEQLPAEGDAVVRIEILGGEFLYAIRLRLLPGSFNLCPADYCDLRVAASDGGEAAAARPETGPKTPGGADGVSGRGLPVERFDPPPEVVEDAKRLVAAAGMDLGGVEYLVDARDGTPTFYDVNALSNFVADALNVIGFDPFVNLVDLILERAGALVTA